MFGPNNPNSRTANTCYSVLDGPCPCLNRKPFTPDSSFDIFEVRLKKIGTFMRVSHEKDRIFQVFKSNKKGVIFLFTVK